jgi:hypothetical protein
MSINEGSSSKVKRRLPLLKKSIESVMGFIAVTPENFDHYLDRIIFFSIREFLSTFENDYSEILKLRDEMEEDLRNYIIREYRDMIYDHYKTESEED